MLRIIARLDIKGPNLVKGIQFEGLRVLGHPDAFARRYAAEGVDEIIYIDSVASLYGRPPLPDFVRKATEGIFIPVTVGGGIRTVEDIQRLLRSGADKVAINTGGLHNPELIREGSRTFGSQCIVLSVVAKRFGDRYECMTHNGRERTGRVVIDWIQKGVDLGAGEILLTSLDREGTGTGLDLELVGSIADRIPIPLIVSGGVGRLEHVAQLAGTLPVGAVACASLFHFAFLQNGGRQEERPFEEGNTDFLQDREGQEWLGWRSIDPTTIRELKESLAERGISVRPLSPLHDLQETQAIHY